MASHRIPFEFVINKVVNKLKVGAMMELIKLKCSTQVRMKFELFIIAKMLKNKDFLAFKLSHVVFYQ